MKLLSFTLIAALLVGLLAVIPAAEAYPIRHTHRRSVARYKRSVPAFEAQYNVPGIYEKV